MAKWTKEIIKDKLKTDDKWVCRGIVAIHNFQTAEEQNSEATLEDNGVGFNGVDATLLSSFAKGINQYGGLTDGQMVYGRKKMLKYAGQLAKIANGEIS